MKALKKFDPGTLTRNDLVELTDKLKRKSATEIFRRLGVRRYTLRGTTYATPGLAALEGLPKKAPIRVINPDHWYSAEELLDLYKQWASNAELEQITKL
jgi:hypothetical protein